MEVVPKVQEPAITQEKAKFCPNCGTPIERDAAAFCAYCGSKL